MPASTLLATIALAFPAEGPGALRALEGPDLTRYFLVCGLLIAATVVTGVLFRRLLRGSLRARAAKRSLGVVDVLPLGTRQKLVVVRCYDRSFLLGVGDKEVSLVAELDPEAEAAPERAVVPRAASVPRVPFRELFARSGGVVPRPSDAQPAEKLVEGGILG